MSSSVTRLTFASCTLLLLLFAVLSWTAISHKSATYDETLHAPAGYSYLKNFDFRANPEHPPLWKYYASLPWLLWPPASINAGSKEYNDIRDDITNQWAWAKLTLYHTPGNDPVQLLAMSRAMMLSLSVLLGATLCYIAHRLAGPVAAIVAASLFCLDPNFLAHASLVTNDLCFCLTVLLLAYFLYLLGQRITVFRALAVACLCGVSITTKFTGVLTIPILITTLGIRAMLPSPWSGLAMRLRRAGASVLICLLTAIITYLIIWGVYGFRFSTAPDPAVHHNINQMVAEAAVNEIMSHTGQPATRQQLHDWYPSLYPRAVLFCLSNHLFPEAFLNGLFFAYSKSLFRYSFLLNHTYATGNLAYFPIAFLVKTPLATLAAILAVIVACFRSQTLRRSFDHWFLACFLLPPIILGYAAVSSHMNIGLRHIFPVYIFLFLFIAVIASRLRMGRIPIIVFLLFLSAETIPAFPNYIPFFNTLAGGYRGGLSLLGDSNLDWGQDLPLLADFQHDNPDRVLYIAYFGTADPSFYNIHATPLIFDNGLEVPDRRLPTSGLLAVSATTLQGIWSPPPRHNPFQNLRQKTPVAILGGTIYVYDLDSP